MSFLAAKIKKKVSKKLIKTKNLLSNISFSTLFNFLFAL